MENETESYDWNVIQSYSLRNGRHILQFYDCLMTIHDDCMKIATKMDPEIILKIVSKIDLEIVPNYYCQWKNDFSLNKRQTIEYRQTTTDENYELMSLRIAQSRLKIFSRSFN